jgi:hypothetical protein
LSGAKSSISSGAVVVVVVEVVEVEDDDDAEDIVFFANRNEVPLRRCVGGPLQQLAVLVVSPFLDEFEDDDDDGVVTTEKRTPNGTLSWYGKSNRSKSVMPRDPSLLRWLLSTLVLALLTSTDDLDEACS